MSGALSRQGSRDSSSSARPTLDNVNDGDVAVAEKEEEEAIHPRSSVANRPFGSSAVYVPILRRRRRGR